MQPAKTMHRSLDDLVAFAAVAQHGSFTRAAATLEVSTSMLSYIIKRLEQRLGATLLRRTSRSVSLSEAGERLLSTLKPALEAIHGGLATLGEERQRIVGTLRLTMTREAYRSVIRPLLVDFCSTYPDVTLEISIDYGFRDVVADRFDAGIRLGEKLERDMVATPIGPRLRMAVVASPLYFSSHAEPKIPRDLLTHRCINYRMVSAEAIYAWEFEKRGRAQNIKLSGPLIYNEPELMLDAALEGLGIAYVLEREVNAHVESGRLRRVLEDWTPSFPGFHLYYPSRKQVSTGLSALVAFLQKRRSRQT